MTLIEQQKAATLALAKANRTKSIMAGTAGAVVGFGALISGSPRVALAASIAGIAGQAYYEGKTQQACEFYNMLK